MFWFHCGRCGSMFQSEAGEPEGRLCPKCGFDPSPGILNVPEESAKPGTTPNTSGPNGEQSPQKHKVRNYEINRGQDRTLTRALIGIVVMLTALTVYKTGFLFREKPPEKTPVATISTPVPKVTADEIVLLNKATPECAVAFLGFLASTTPEERNQFVLAPVSTASRMSRFYSLNPWAKIDPKTLEFTAKSILHLAGATAIETQWKSQDGKQIDAVFLEEDGEWRLDWDHFARHSDYPWSLFLAGTGPSEGEFRLIARERLAGERKDEESISIVLYAPRFGQPHEIGFASSEFLVSRNTRDGQLLDAAFKLARSNGRIFDSLLPNLDPEDMIRVRVTVRRIDTEGERKFEISRVIACHWYSVDAPGVEPLAPVEATPGED